MITLTEREREIVLLAAEGLGDKEIAKKLDIAESTVRTYWDRLRPKLGAQNRAQAAALATISLYRETELRLNRELKRSQLIIQNVSDYAIFTMDRRKRITSWNPGVQKIFGYTEEEFLGRDGSMIFVEEDRRNSIPEQEMHRAEASGRADDKRWHLRKDGTRFWGSGVVVPLQDGDAPPREFAKLVQDGTERKRLEERVFELENLAADKV